MLLRLWHMWCSNTGMWASESVPVTHTHTYIYKHIYIYIYKHIYIYIYIYISTSHLRQKNKNIQERFNKWGEMIKQKGFTTLGFDVANTMGRSSSLNPPYSLSEATTNYSKYNSNICKYDRSWREEEESRRRFAFTNPEFLLLLVASNGEMPRKRVSRLGLLTGKSINR